MAKKILENSSSVLPGLLLLSPSISPSISMAFVRSQSFYDFLCEGDATRLPEGAEVPRCILEQFPVTVQDRSLIQVPGPRMQRNICDRIVSYRNCDRLSNCPHIHPDFIAERWVVPDLLCHKWFPGHLRF